MRSLDSSFRDCEEKKVTACADSQEILHFSISRDYNSPDMILIRRLTFLFLLFSISTTASALPIETCRNQNRIYHEKLIVQLDELDGLYSRYRWIEAKIRRLYYDNIWEARLQGNDPLAANKREKGQALEKNNLELLNLLKHDSETASNGFVQMLEKIKQTDFNVAGFCERRDVQTCLVQDYDTFYKMMDQAREIFTRIFEHERDYRTAVENASGGRDGLYPDDVLESSGDHTDFYWRFEQPKSQERFEEDSEMMRLVMTAKQLIYFENTGEGCCRQCV